MPIRQTGMPILPLTALATDRADPQAGLTALRRMLGVPEGTESFMADPTGSLQLDDLRGDRQRELEMRVANDAFGDPRRPDPNTGRDALLLKFLRGERDADPFTGQDAIDRTHRIENSLDEAALYDRPDITKMRRDQLSDKVMLAGAPGRVAGEYGLAKQRLENEGNLAKQRIASDAAIEAAGIKGKGGVSGHILSSGLMERVAAGAGALQQLDHLISLRPKVSIGPAAGRTQSLLQSLPLIPASKDFATFKAESASVKNTIIKAATGAQMSKEEGVRLGAEVPDENDKDDVWDAKMQIARQKIRGLNRRIELLNKGVPVDELGGVDDLYALGAGEDAAPSPGAASAAGGADEVVGITRGSGSTGNAFGDLMQRADRAAQPRR